jgi:hypothetical protein
MQKSVKRIDMKVAGDLALRLTKKLIDDAVKKGILETYALLYEIETLATFAQSADDSVGDSLQLKETVRVGRNEFGLDDEGLMQFYAVVLVAYSAALCSELHL